MNRFKFLIIGILFVVLCGGLYILLVSKRQQGNPSPSGTLHLVASFYPLAYIASGVAGDRATVETLTPPGSEPHDFEPTARTIAGLSTADLFLYNGGGFEPWVTSWIKGEFTRPRESLNMLEALKENGVTLIETEQGTDPHVWLDPALLSKEVEIVRDTLIRLDPLSETIYQDNAERLIARLTSLDNSFKAGLRLCDLTDIIVSHEAFAYLARAYGLSMTAIAGISPDEEPSPKTLAEIVDVARAKKARYIFFETTASPKLSESIARELGIQTLVLNTLESLTTNEVQSGEDYTHVMRQNLTNLRKALVCR